MPPSCDGGGSGGAPAAEKRIVAGGLTTCAIKADHTLWCWGDNLGGQIGDGTTVEKHTPVPVSALGADVAAVACGKGHTCARKTDGTLWCWGVNAFGGLGDGTTLDKTLPVQVVALGGNVANVAASSFSTWARKTDGTLWSWGGNFQGQLADGTTVEKHAPVQVSALGATVAEVSAGGATCARKTDGTLWCWGYNVHGQIGDGTTVNKPSPVQVSTLGNCVAEVAPGGATCARRTDGSLWCWGLNDHGQIGDGTTVNKSSPVQVSALGTSVAEVSAGFTHTCARKTDGTLWCWGTNASGQIGDGTTQDRHTPVQVSALGASVAAVSVSQGGGYTCAEKTDGSFWCWGNNKSGQLGDGTTVDKHVPVQVP
jgi:alpha-tubulin suppressor-like RCC1 family protein